MSIITELTQEAPRLFGDVITQSPQQAILVILGALVVGAASVVFGVLSVGGVLSALSKALPSGGPPDGRQS